VFIGLISISLAFLHYENQAIPKMGHWRPGKVLAGTRERGQIQNTGSPGKYSTVGNPTSMFM